MKLIFAPVFFTFTMLMLMLILTNDIQELYRLQKISKRIQLKYDQTSQLLNKPFVNEIILRVQNIS